MTLDSVASNTACTDHAGLLPNGLAHLRALLKGADHTLLPPTASWRLMLALQLLAELRDPRSPLAPYVRALPAPPGTRIAAVCCGGPADTALLLFRCLGTVGRVFAPDVRQGPGVITVLRRRPASLPSQQHAVLGVGAHAADAPQFARFGLSEAKRAHRVHCSRCSRDDLLLRTQLAT